MVVKAGPAEVSVDHDDLAAGLGVSDPEIRDQCRGALLRPGTGQEDDRREPVGRGKPQARLQPADTAGHRRFWIGAHDDLSRSPTTGPREGMRASRGSPSSRTSSSGVRIRVSIVSSSSANAKAKSTASANARAALRSGRGATCSGLLAGRTTVAFAGRTAAAETSCSRVRINRLYTPLWRGGRGPCRRAQWLGHEGDAGSRAVGRCWLARRAPPERAWPIERRSHGRRTPQRTPSSNAGPAWASQPSPR